MYDFIAIGDTVIDAFIRLTEASKASVQGEPDQASYKICLPFAEKIPYEDVFVVNAVGNGPNAAVSASRLGLKVAMVSDLGGDQNGKDCLEEFKRNNISTDFIKIHSDQKTNYHYVLWYGSERTILVKHEDYPYSFPEIGEPKWIYLTSLGETTLDYHLQIAEYLKSHPGVKLAFQPGTFQMKLGTEKLKDIYARTEIFFCNVEEAGRILGIDTLGVEELLKRIKALGPKMVVITDGPKGAYAYDGTNIYNQLPYPDIKPPLERTGAGDAFASTTVAALALGKDLPTALKWGAVNSMSVVQEVGAQKGLLSREKLEEYLSK